MQPLLPHLPTLFPGLAPWVTKRGGYVFLVLPTCFMPPMLGIPLVPLPTISQPPYLTKMPRKLS